MIETGQDVMLRGIRWTYDGSYQGSVGAIARLSRIVRVERWPGGEPEERTREVTEAPVSHLTPLPPGVALAAIDAAVTAYPWSGAHFPRIDAGEAISAMFRAGFDLEIAAAVARRADAYDASLESP